MQSLLFDLDGTLLDHFTCLARCYEHVLSELDQPIPSRDRIKRAVGGSVELTMANFVPDDLHKEACVRWKIQLKEILTEDAFLLPGGLPLIQALNLKVNNWQYLLTRLANIPAPFATTWKSPNTWML